MLGNEAEVSRRIVLSRDVYRVRESSVASFLSADTGLKYVPTLEKLDALTWLASPTTNTAVTDAEIPVGR